MATERGRQSGWNTALWWGGGFALFALVITLNRDFETFLRYLVLGLPQGAIIALIAVGYSMVYGIIQLINFAHGEVFMFSTFFVLMLLVPPEGGQTMAPALIGATVFLIVACTVWVLAERIPARWMRGAVAVAAGAAAAAANARLMPATGAGAAILPFFAAYALAIVYTCCLGVTMDLLAYRPLRHSPRLIALITAIGLSLFLQNFAQLIWGSSSRYFPASVRPAILGSQQVTLTPALSLSRLDLVIVVLALALMAGLQLFVMKTRTGRAMRACAQDRVTASLMGVEVNRVVAVAFALGAGLAAMVAPLYVLRGTPIHPQMGYMVGILAFSSAVLGGIGNITGAMLGGMVIGIVSAFVPLFDALDRFAWFEAAVRAGWITREGYAEFVQGFGKPGQYQLAVAYAFMILVIVFKPTGLLGKASAKRA
ncbi:MAG: branched-chain amino acid ABC transporter permease [Candidatus Sumerlaeaceae bacterium]|nr:branched-chain amino acid ABC transporter permease [Candidatus Sumerlaeaceae bacterium]